MRMKDKGKRKMQFCDLCAAGGRKRAGGVLWPFRSLSFRFGLDYDKALLVAAGCEL